ncbi:MAG: hypothetical protein RSA41_07895, partial [Christensenella sp.]
LRALPQAVMTSRLMRADYIRPYKGNTKCTLKKNAEPYLTKIGFSVTLAEQRGFEPPERY